MLGRVCMHASFQLYSHHLGLWNIRDFYNSIQGPWLATNLSLDMMKWPWWSLHPAHSWTHVYTHTHTLLWGVSHTLFCYRGPTVSLISCSREHLCPQQVQPPNLPPYTLHICFPICVTAKINSVFNTHTHTKSFGTLCQTFFRRFFPQNRTSTPSRVNPLEVPPLPVLESL